MITTEAARQNVPRPRGGGDGRVVDRSDFDQFVAARSTALLRTAYLLTHDHGIAEDLLQTALAKAWFAWRRIDGHPEPYVRKIRVNTYATWWRRKWNGEYAADEVPETIQADASEASDESHDLWLAMERLPRRQGAVVVLRYFEDLTEAQTADLLGCSVGTVKSQASKALAKLRVDPALAADDQEELRRPASTSCAGPWRTTPPRSGTPTCWGVRRRSTTASAWYAVGGAWSWPVAPRRSSRSPAGSRCCPTPSTPTRPIARWSVSRRRAR